MSTDQRGTDGKDCAFLNFSLKDTTRLSSLNILHVSKTWSLLSVKHLKVDVHEEGFKYLERLETGCPEFLLWLHLFFFLFCLYLHTVGEGR